MESIKYMNASVSDKLFELSQTKKYDSFYELLKDFPGDSRQLDILVKLNYFSEFGDIPTLLSIIDIYNAYSGRKQLDKTTCAVPREIMLQFATETEKRYQLTDCDGLIKYLCDHAEPKPFTLIERLKAEQEYLGYISYRSTDPRDQWKAVVLDVNTKFSPRITIYNLYTGKTSAVKCYKKTFTTTPLEKGMIITYFTESKEKCQRDATTGNWTPTGEYENWFKWYTVKEE